MKTFRILNLDGGGSKGLFSAYFMKKFCEQAEIDPTEIWKHFDLIVGASIGAIMGCGYAIGTTPDQLIDFFTTYSPQIFRDATPPAKSPMSAARKQYLFVTPVSTPITPGRNFAIGTSEFPGGQSFYGGTTSGSTTNQQSNTPNIVLSTQLQSVFGTKKMFELKSNVIIGAIERKLDPVSEQELAFSYRPALFSNFIAEGLEGQNHLVWEATQASASAPIYFPPMKITGTTEGASYIDLGLCLNNMSGIALGYSGIIAPRATKICMLSVGCGLGTVGFFETKENPTANGATTIGDNIEYTTQMIGVAGTGAQEATAKQMDLFSRYNVKINNANFYHYRFNNEFKESVNTELDSSGEEFNAEMLRACEEKYNLDQLKINLFIQNCNFNN